MLPDEMYALDFTQEHYETLLDTLSQHYPSEELMEKRGAIKQGIVDFFADTLQEISISIVNGMVKITKVFAYPAKGEAFDRLVHELNLDLLAILENEAQYKHAEFLWIIPGDVREEMLVRFEPLPEEVARTVVRRAIETVFELDDKDIVLFLRSRIYIRDYLPPKPVPTGVERRYAGEDPEEMESLFDECFPEGIDEEIEEYLPEVLEESLNFTKIDNHAFNRSYIQVFRSMIEIIVVEAVEGFPADKLEGFTGFVLRQYFDDILIYTARNLLHYVEERDKNAETFIKYYKDEVVIDPSDGRKIQKYAIIDAKNQTWNYSAILSILMQYKQAKKRVKQQETKIAAIDARIEEVERELAHERQERRKVDQQLRELNETISMKKVYMERSSRSGDAISQAQIQKEYSHLLDQQKIAKDNAIFADRRYKNKHTEHENWKKQLATNQKMLDEIRQQNDNIMEMIELIVEAIAVVFAKR